MDGIHDLGGKQGFGRVQRERNERVFHDRWEAAVFAMVRAAGSAGVLKNSDQFRHAVERIEPVAYLSHGYYGRWLGGLENLLVEAGVLKQKEIDRRALELGADPAWQVAARPAAQPDVVGYESEESSAIRPLATKPLYQIGDLVCARGVGVAGHTRLPAYIRGREGRISAWHDGWVLPDSNAHGRGENPEHLYTVAFSSAELWGEQSEPGLVVHIDLFESYLIKM
ncbi:MAG: nitrile hydratase subunit beta [Gammaproteobacteria bacterium]|nr:nitrile hydratase subunit beta [Gammaproteobacteria bacterium]